MIARKKYNYSPVNPITGEKESEFKKYSPSPSTAYLRFFYEGSSGGWPP